MHQYCSGCQELQIRIILPVTMERKLEGKEDNLIEKTFCQLTISPTSNIIQFPL